MTWIQGAILAVEKFSNAVILHVQHRKLRFASPWDTESKFRRQEWPLAQLTPMRSLGRWISRQLAIFPFQTWIRKSQTKNSFAVSRFQLGPNMGEQRWNFPERPCEFFKQFILSLRDMDH
jgi:hypothetical protein